MGDIVEVLVIDDDELVREICANIIKREGHVVLQADNGNSGLAAFKNNQPDLIITDIFMPEKDGLETISEIIAINPEAKIIAISGGIDNTKYLQIAKKLGASHTLQKPFKNTDLITAMNSLMPGSQLHHKTYIP